MKFSISQIITDHFATLRDASSNRISIEDMVWFFVGPALPAGAVLALRPEIGDVFYTTFVAALSVFAALLVSSQFSIFSLINKSRVRSDDEIIDQELKEGKIREINALREVNATISYLIAIGSISLVLGLLLLLLEFNKVWEAAFCIYIAVHFLMTLLMVLKRIHILLSRNITEPF